MKWWRVAASAVSVRHGSITTTLPPRSRIAFRRLATSGALMMLPFEATGFAPRISQYAVWSRSGIGSMK